MQSAAAPETSSVELKPHGNVYALAINKSGSPCAPPALKQGNERVILSANPEKSKD